MSSPPDVGVVVVAGGRGARLGGDTPKQFLEIAGVPMLLRALRPFMAHPAVAQVVVVLPAEQAKAPPHWLAGHAGERLRITSGGAERSDSVANGLAALGESIRFVLVHDAARPFPRTSLIDRVLAAARRGVGAVPAVAVADTVKELDATQQQRVARTVPRDRLVRAQTPQGFPVDMLVRAHERARRDGFSGTDDASLVERLGEPVEVVAGDSRNIKVTTPEDLVLAEWLASHPS